jgi:hypothetical protein
MPTLDADTLSRTLSDAITGPGFVRATFAGAVRGTNPHGWVRVVVRPVIVRGEARVQFSYFDAKQDTTKNFSPNDVGEPLAELLAVGFAGVHVTTSTEELDVRVSKKGAIHLGRKRIAVASDTPVSHNRVKDVPLPEGRADRVLEVMGILTADGRVRPTMRAKFTQINEFLKHLNHVLGDAGLRDLGRPIEILDCGCGSSYLTIAAHHYLNDVLGMPAHVIGVDVNEDVIRKSVERTAKLGDGPAFACGRIGEFAAKPDVVVALHACDTATDDAIAQAVRGDARLLLSVPCCHHALNREIAPEGPASVLRPILRHGILHQRTADLVTDAFRALALRIMGYRTDVVEFVSPEHTARNLMIRAVSGASVGEPAFVQEYRELKRFWGVTPYIEAALGERFTHLL